MKRLHLRYELVPQYGRGVAIERGPKALLSISVVSWRSPLCLSVQRGFSVASQLRASRMMGSTVEVGRVKIVFAGNTDQGEERVASGIGQGCSHPLRRRRI